MRISFAWLVFCVTLIVGAFCSSKAVEAGTSAIAISGDSAAGVASGIFDSLSAGPLTNDVKYAFSARLEIGPGGVTTVDDQGIWHSDGTTSSLVAREGSAGVPGVVDANFESFADLSIASTDDVLVRATLQTGIGGVTVDSQQGFWRYSDGVGTLLARTGAGSVPSVAGASFNFLELSIHASREGRLAYLGTMEHGGGGVSTNDDRGIWSDDQGVGDLVVREGSSHTVPGIPSVLFSNFGEPAINNNDQTVFLATVDGGSSSSANNLGLWQYTGTSGTLLARKGVGNVPGVGGADFTVFEQYTLNDSDQVAMIATLDTGEQGIWQYTTGAGSLLGLTGAAGVPGIAGANFEAFNNPLMNDAGQVLVKAELEVGTGGVTSTDNRGIWFLDGSGNLELRTGSGGVPDLPGTKFFDFTEYSLNQNGQFAIAATLENGVGGVDSSNDSGLWLIDPNGTSRLVAREGDNLAGRTIDSLDFFAGSDGNAGQLSGLNDLGHLLFQATFTDGDSGLFLFNPLDADFDFNAQVDSSDHVVWKGGFGSSSVAGQMQGDSDGDQDVDGLDFLAFQREYGTGIPEPLTLQAIPEPSSMLLLLSGAVGCLFGTRRRK